MPTVGVRQFREELSTYLDSSTPVDVTRHGQVIGTYIPQERRRPFDRQRFDELAERVDAMLSRQGVDPDELIGEYETSRQSGNA
ncbi:MAG: hypothetical protein LBV30_04210 [Propionibacteriaceae bacterium]|jgi:antitoxin (DNA-binding transcriptional repressor) of toxin-antitoxin stability system|nr:hypothetical protein [Propionibacteriaceae bacterium]